MGPVARAAEGETGQWVALSFPLSALSYSVPPNADYLRGMIRDLRMEIETRFLDKLGMTTAWMSIRNMETRSQRRSRFAAGGIAP